MIQKLTLITLCFFLLAPCSSIAGPGGSGGPPPTVVLATITSADVTPSAEYVGHVEAIQTVDLVAQVSGKVEAIHCEDGSFVQKNDPLFTIEQEVYQARVAAAQAAVAQAEAAKEGNTADMKAALAGVEVAMANRDAAQANLVRATKYLKRMRSVDKRSITEADLELAESNFMKAKASVSEAKALITQRQAQMSQIQAQAKMDTAKLQQAKADLQREKINLGYTSITAPISGKIGLIRTTRGNLVNSGTGPLARIVQIDPVRVVYSISEADLIQVQGAKTKPSSENSRLLAPGLRLPDGKNYPAPGKVTFIDNEIDPTTGTIAVRAEFPNHDGALIPGQYVTVLVKTAPTKILPLVPQVAVMLSKEGSSVLMVNAQGIVTPRPIKTGPAVGGMWAVTSGLTPGEKVIVSGLQKIRPGMPVTVAPGEGGQK